MRRTLIVLVLVLPTAIALGQQFNGYSRRPRRTRNATPTYTRPRPAADGATTRPVAFVVDPKPDLTGPYRILLTRSIFAANHMVLDQRPGSTSLPERQFALRGLSLEDGVYSAFIEDTISHSISRVAIGQAVARGLIVEITLDALHYQREGSKTEVKIGQTLEGFPAPSTSGLSAPEDRFGGRGGNGPTGRFGRGANAIYGRPGVANFSTAAVRTQNRPTGNSANPTGRDTNRPGNATPGGPDENEGDFNPPPGGPPDLGPGSGPGDGPPDGGPGFTPTDEGPGGPPDGPGFGGPPGGPPPEVDGGPGPAGPPGGPDEGPGPGGPPEREV